MMSVTLGAAKKAPLTLPPRRPCIRLGDCEEAQAVSIFTRIAAFDNPSKDVNQLFELVAK
jgi:hypothetical protein